MTTTLSFQIRVIKNQIAACLREIERGVKWFIDRLVLLEGELEKLLQTRVKLSEKAGQIKARLIQGLTEGWNCDESNDLVEKTLEVVDLCNDSQYWEKWGPELLTTNWKNNGFALLSKKIRQYANKKLTSKDPVDLIVMDLADNGLAVKEWENYGKRRLYLYNDGENFGYIDIRKDTISSEAFGEFAKIVSAIVDNRVSAWDSVKPV